MSEPMSESFEDRRFIVPGGLRGQSLERVLEHWLRDVRRPALRRLLREGVVRLNGIEADGRRKVEADDVLELGIETEELPRRARRAEGRPPVLYEDQACLVIGKPASLASVPDRHGEPSVHGRLAEWFGAEDLRFVHRLDKGTSGVLLLAKGSAAARSLEQQFRERKIEKRYLALVHGHPPTDEFRCDTPIGRTIRGGKVKLGEAKGAREARTDFLVRRRFRGYALLDARPRTGRMHQIRAHLMCISLPLAVDPLYGGASALFLSGFKRGYRAKREERPLIDRLTLHAQRMAFTTPDGGTRVEVEADCPKDLRVTLAKLERYA